MGGQALRHGIYRIDILLRQLNHFTVEAVNHVGRYTLKIFFLHNVADELELFLDLYHSVHVNFVIVGRLL